MRVHVAAGIEGPFQAKPGRYKSEIATRVWWLWFWAKIVHVDEVTYATTSYTWEDRC